MSSIIKHYTVEETINFVDLSSPIDMNEYHCENIRVTDKLKTLVTYVYTKKESDGKIYISNFGRKAINSHYDLSGEKISTDIDYISGFREETKVLICKPESMVAFVNKRVTAGGVIDLLNRSGEFTLAKFIVYMHGLPGFDSLYRDYCNDPDINVVKPTLGGSLPDELVTKAEEYGMEPIVNDSSIAYSRSEFQCIAYLLVLFMNKKLQNQNQLTEVIEKRADAFCISTLYSSVDTKKLAELFQYSTISIVSKKMAFYPKLKSLIHTMILAGTSSACGHMRVILQDTQLTLFNFIYVFLTHPRKTQLHIEHKVLSETRTWLQTFKKLKNAYGLNWRYFKLFEPQNPLTSVNEIPALASAALTFVYVHVDMSGTTGKLESRIKSDLGYQALACRIMSPEYLLSKKTAIDVDAIKKEFADADIEIGYELAQVISAKNWISIEEEVNKMLKDRETRK